MMAGFDEQVADAAGAERLTNQADRSMGQFLERAGLLTDASQFVECVEPVAERSLGGGPVEQLGAQPEVGQRDAADARDRLEKVDVVLFAARRLGPFEMEDARQPIVDPKWQYCLGALTRVAVRFAPRPREPDAVV